MRSKILLLVHRRTSTKAFLLRISMNLLDSERILVPQSTKPSLFKRYRSLSSHSMVKTNRGKVRNHTHKKLCHVIAPHVFSPHVTQSIQAIDLADRSLIGSTTNLKTTRKTLRYLSRHGRKNASKVRSLREQR